MKKLLSIPAVVREAKRIDPDTAINAGMIITLIDAASISFIQFNAQKRIDFSRFKAELSTIFGLPGEKFPRLRTLPEAWKYQHSAGLGFSENFIRDSVREGVVSSIKVGNREYLALDLFDEPFVDRFSDSSLRPAPQRVIVPQNDIHVTPSMPAFRRK